MFVELKHAPTTSAIARQHIEDLEAHLVERNWSLGQINSENRGLDSRYYLKDEMSKSTHYDNIPPHTTHHTPHTKQNIPTTHHIYFISCFSTSPGGLQTSHVCYYEAPKREFEIRSSHTAWRIR